MSVRPDERRDERPGWGASASSGVAAALVAAAVSGVAVFLNGLAVKGPGGPALHTTAKNAVAALVLGVAVVALTRRGSSTGWTRPTTATQVVGLAAVAVVGGGVAFVLFFEGLARASSTDAALLHKTLVVWVALAAPVALGERVGWPVVAGVAGLVAGQAIVAGGLDGVGLGSAEAMILAATLLWAGEVLVAKRLLGELSPLTVGAVRLGGGLLVLVVWMAATGALATIPDAGAEVWVWVLVTGLVLAGYVACWLTALAHAPATVVTAVLVLAVPVTAALDSAFRGAGLTPKLEGLIVILVAGLVVAVWPRPRREAPEGAPEGANERELAS
jgi:drug/metabolite transporter (DMT)-like permease